MPRLSKWLICAVIVRGATAQAEEAPTQAAGHLTDEELVELSQAETIEVYDERPDKPFDRDTEVRLTGEQLAARGATDLGSALALLPDVTVRDGGRGGFNIDIRGARKGAVSILIDGVLVTDPYYGTFDVSTIPITDIVQIRLSTAPQSPIDGPGGPGGVIEVITRDAYGEQLVIARATGDSLPSFGITGTARVRLSEDFALRLAMSGLAGARDMELPSSASIGEQRRAATGSARLEYRDATARVVVDGFLDDRHYVSPPSEDETSMAPILMIDRETTLRSSIKADKKRGDLQLQAQGWVHQLARRSRYFRDPAFTDQSSFEMLDAVRTGAMALATNPIGKRSRWAASASIDHATATVANNANTVSGGITLAETAVNFQYEHATVRVDAAGGVALPLGVGADPWPEAKLVGRWRPSFGPLEVLATAARKGRVPSLKERYEPRGNAALGPEMISHGELRGVYDVKERIKVEVAPFYRRTTGTVRASTDPADMGILMNLGKLNFYGVDTSVRAALPATLELGASYSYIRARSEESDEPLDRLPHHRADAWLQGRPMQRLTLLARARYFGESIDRTMTVPHYMLVELTATAQLTREHLAVLRVEDLVDVRPETRNGYFAPGRVITLVMQGQWQ